MAEVRLYSPDEVPVDDWDNLQIVFRDSFQHALPHRTIAEIDTLSRWDDPAAFIASREYPNRQVGEVFNPLQEFLKPRIAIARADEEIVGYGYAADNISGDPVARRVKRLIDQKRYFWLREIVVHPEVQGEGIARDIARTLLADARSKQRPTAYIWPDEIDSMGPRLVGLGFEATGQQMVNVFGEGSAPVRQVRMQATSVAHVLENL